MKFALIARALTSIAVASTSTAHEIVPKGFFAAIGVSESQGDDGFVNSPCFSIGEAAYQCAVDSGANQDDIMGCTECFPPEDTESCSDIDCETITGCFATSCGGCADKMEDLFNCILTEEAGCDSCSGKDTDEVPEFMKDLSKEAIEVYKKNAAQKRQDQRDRRRAFDNPHRSRAEEDRERARKDRQNRNSGRRDPYYNDNGSRSAYGHGRDARRSANCRRNGRDCDENEVEDSSVGVPRVMKEVSNFVEVFKRNAAQKRQDQRDRRRAFDNPHRSRAEEDRERARKDRQNRNSGRRDPYYNDNGSRSAYGHGRDARRSANCRRNGRDCDESEE